MQDISLENAVEILLSNVREKQETEFLPLLDSIGRISARRQVAAFPNPPFDRSPLDGYTFHSSSVANGSKESPARLDIIGEECAGDFFEGEVGKGQAVRIMTGAAIPKGCDCVVRQEDVFTEGDSLFVPFTMKPYENYCYKGEDIKEGTALVGEGDEITAAHIAVLASEGIDKVEVYRSIRIAIASTGDELVLPGETLGKGKIYNSNLFLLAGRLREMGFSPTVIGTLPDEPDKAAEVILKHSKDTELFLTTGGVSVGKKDIMHSVVPKIGAERLFWRVLMKPGAPAIGYRLGDMLGVALSGNPFAAYATFEMLVRPVLAKISRRKSVALKRRRAKLADSFPKVSDGRRFIRAMVEGDSVRLPKNHDSGALFSAVGCNGFVDVPAGSPPLVEGEEVEVVCIY